MGRKRSPEIDLQIHQKRQKMPSVGEGAEKGELSCMLAENVRVFEKQFGYLQKFTMCMPYAQQFH
jgi:hypothetical protein